MKYLILTSLSLSITIMFLKHPLSLGFILLMQTINISLMINMLNMNFWFSYILILIMIGGMLILFIYMTSIASNEKFFFSNNLLLVFINYIIIMIMAMMIDNFYFNNLYINTETTMTNLNLSFIFILNKFLTYPNLMIFCITIIHLLITLIAVVKISNPSMGPLRQKN